VYSFGILIWEVLERCAPYDRNSDFPSSPLQQIEYITSGGRPREGHGCFDMGLRVVELMRRCWHQEPSERPTFGDALQILKIEYNARASAISDGDGFLEHPADGVRMMATSFKARPRATDPMRASGRSRGMSDSALGKSLLSSSPP
jgi:hypothetical protein